MWLQAVLQTRIRMLARLLGWMAKKLHKIPLQPPISKQKAGLCMLFTNMTGINHLPHQETFGVCPVFRI